MTLTRSQLGETPRKTEHPGYVETPTRRSNRPRSEEDAFVSAMTTRSNRKSGEVSESATMMTTRSSRKSGEVNGSATMTPRPRGRPPKEKKSDRQDHRIDGSGQFEFGGSVGVSLMMIIFPLIMWYMWIGATYYEGKLPWPKRNESWSHFGLVMVQLVYTGAFPTARAWLIYWAFFVFEALCYLYLPGITVQGKPLEWEGGRRLDYYCSGVWSWSATLIAAGLLHVTGLFKLDAIMDDFGPIMTVAIISGFVVSVIAYFSALARGAEHRMSGAPIYDFFMGAELNPRLFGRLDFKMFFEVRIPWYMLFLVTLGAATRQYEQYGYVSGEIGFLLLAHFLYANACSKGEELIVTSWDMYYEKWGFMLIFWNLAGVPLSYCHCTIYLANHPPSTYHWNPFALAALYISYLFVYWVWDTCNSQKNRFRQQERGTLMLRKTFPQLPWQSVKDPAETIKTDTGDSILVDGWYAHARKIHYTCDLYFAITWGLITGFNSPFPWFYAAFFTPMIIHRALRDQEKCRRRYGDAWTEYERRVPYLFIPYVI